MLRNYVTQQLIYNKNQFKKPQQKNTEKLRE